MIAHNVLISFQSVYVRHQQKSISLPVKPDTTAAELIRSASAMLALDLSPESSILIEAYTKIGLERPIRMYERIRDILNSWDEDSQNEVIIQRSGPGYHPELDLRSVPAEQPGDTTVYMYHSQKPGKWSKRHVTLLSSGQVYISRKAGAIAKEKTSSSICHISDFDIYSPTPTHIKKVLHAPKKHCFAIKSQQRPIMFLSTDNFVHFFSTDDDRLAQKWHDAVHQWRSWYLVRQRGDGQPNAFKTSNPYHDPSSFFDPNPSTASPRLGTHESDEDDDDKPLQIPAHLRNPSRRYPPPVSYSPKMLPHLTPSPSPAPTPLMSTNNEQTFSPSGLLGRSYSQRQRAAQHPHATDDATNDLSAQSLGKSPFIDGPSLLNRSTNDDSDAERGHSGRGRTNNDHNRGRFEDLEIATPYGQLPSRQRSSSVRSASHARPSSRPGTSQGPGATPLLDAPGLQRGSTRRDKEHDHERTAMPATPLVDLTPRFQEPAQYSRKEKRGRGVKAPEGMLLVDAATGPQDVVEVPKTYAVRR